MINHYRALSSAASLDIVCTEPKKCYKIVIVTNISIAIDKICNT